MFLDSLFGRKADRNPPKKRAPEGSGKHAAQRHVAPVASLPKKRFNELPTEFPEYEEVLTAPGSKYAIAEALQSKLAAIQIDADTAWVLVDKDFYNRHDCVSLLDRLRRNFKVVSVYHTSASVILTLYAKSSTNGVRRDRDESETALSIILFNDVMLKAAERNASDVHFAIRDDTQTAAVMCRVDGLIRKSLSLPASNALDAIGAAYTKLAEDSSRSDVAFNRRSMQSCTIPMQLNGQFYKIRFQSIPVNGGLDVILRLLQSTSKSAQKPTRLDELGYAQSQCKQLDYAARRTVGAIVVSGVTGSGKSTTLKTLMTLSPTRHTRKSYSIEDPVEYKMFGVSQISVQRKALDEDENGNAAFKAAMRVVLRADPDIIMVGEVRDAESCSLMKSAVQSGHQVMTTVHATSAIDIVQRLTSSELGLPRETLGSRNFLSALIYQRLVSRLCPDCKIPLLKAGTELVPESTIHLLRSKFGLDPSTMFTTNPDGCEHCDHLGSKGVTVVAEVITPDSTILKLLREGRDVEAEEYWRRKRCVQFDHPDCDGKTAFEHGLYKAHLGVVDPVVIENAFEPFETYYIESVADAVPLRFETVPKGVVNGK